MLKTVVLLHIFLETFFSGIIDGYKVQKNSIYLKIYKYVYSFMIDLTVIFGQFNAFEEIDLKKSKNLTDPNSACKDGWMNGLF